MIKKISLLLCLSFMILRGYGQITNEASNADATSNLSEGNSRSALYNTNLYTGTASINIPIFSYTVDGVDAGVSISYDTKGVKVDDIASSVGLGWTLNAGGYIQREVKGVEDECTNGVTKGSWTEYVPPPNNELEQEGDKFIAVFNNRVIHFTVNFAEAYPPVAYTSPKSEIKITTAFNGFNAYCAYCFPSGGEPHTQIYSSSTNNTGLLPNTNELGFIIADESGNQFWFTAADYEHKTIPGSYYPVYKWVLTKIITYSGQQINYHQNTSSLSLSYPAYHSEKVSENTSYPSYLYAPPASFPPNVIVNEIKDVKWEGNISHIADIEYPNGTKVTFDVDWTLRYDVYNAPILKSIKISSQYDNTIKNSLTYNFNYKYFTSPNANYSATESPYSPTDLSATIDLATAYGGGNLNWDTLQYTLRLKLLDIDRVGADGTTTEPYYTFTYNTTPLPNRLSIKQDYYGYYNNGSTSSYSGYDLGIPYHLATVGSSTITYGTVRDPSVTYAQACILTSIKNQTGGITNLSYTMPTFSNSFSGIYFIRDFAPYGTGITGGIDPDLTQISACDGLCIDHISTFDGYNHDNDVTESYTYSNGEKLYAGNYYFYPSILGEPTAGSTAFEAVENVWSNYPVNPKELFNGSDHGFQTVTVTKTGYTSEQISKKEYNFTGLYRTWTSTDNYPNLRVEGGILYHTKPRNYFLTAFLGLPLDIKEYDPAGNIIYEKQNSYIVNKESTPHVTNDNSYYFQYKTPWPVYSMPWIVYNQPVHYQNLPNYSDTYTGIQLPLLSQSTTTKHSGTLSQSTPIYYTYDSHDHLTLAQWDDSRLGTCYKRYLWNYFTTPTAGVYTIPTLPSILQYNIGYILKRGSADVVKQYTWPEVGDVLATSGSPVGGAYYVKMRFPKIYTGTYSPDPATITVTDYVAIENTQYDDHENLLESKDDVKNTYSAFIWDTRLGKKLAEVNNAQYSDIAATSFEGPFSAFGTQDYNKGNWDFYPANVTIASTITGHYYYDISSNTNSTITSNNIPVNSKKYMISFWSKDFTPKVYLGSTFISLTQQLQIGDWKLYTASFTGDGTNHVTVNSPSTSIGGLNSYIDELRLYPVGASMTTYTYEPLFGASSVCDERNNIVYTEYDAQGRPNITRDINRNIISLTQRTNQGND